MKFSQRLFCVLLCCALLFPVFSFTASAESLDFKELQVTDTVKMITAWDSIYDEYSFITNDGTKTTKEFSVAKAIPAGYTSVTVSHMYAVEILGGSPILSKGQEGHITLYNAYMSQFAQSTEITPPIQYFRQIDTVRALVYYSDGTKQYYDNVTAEQPITSHNNFSFEITAKADIVKIEYITTSKFTIPEPLSTNVAVYVHIGENAAADAAMRLEVVTEEVKLLNGIIEWLKGIKNGISELFTNVSNGFTNVINKANDIFNKIVELPQLIWDKIKNGLISLFVPSASNISDMQSRMDTILANKLGAVYQVGDLLTDSWDSINHYDELNIINIPSATIDLPNDMTYTFGGYEVPIVPNKFEFLANICKAFVGVIATFAFYNGLRKRYDEVFH